MFISQKMINRAILVASFVIFVAIISTHLLDLLPSTEESENSRTERSSKPEVERERQQEAVKDLIVRLLPKHASNFDIIINSNLGTAQHDTFEYVSKEERLVIQGTSGVAAATALHHFLKYDCFAHVSWNGDQLKIPNPFPRVLEKAVRVSSPYRLE